MLKDWLYWLQFFVLPLLGVGLVWVYIKSGTVMLNTILAAQIGTSAPLIIKAFASAASALPQEQR